MHVMRILSCNGSELKVVWIRIFSFGKTEFNIFDMCSVLMSSISCSLKPIRSSSYELSISDIVGFLLELQSVSLWIEFICECFDKIEFVLLPFNRHV